MKISKSDSKINKMKFNKCLQIVWMLLPVLLLSQSSNVSLVNANGGEQVSCYDRGFIDGEDYPFNQNTYERCGDDYYQGFLEGCMSVEGNDRDICESATDA